MDSRDVRAVQRLVLMLAPGFVVDGVLGPNTAAAVSLLEPELLDELQLEASELVVIEEGRRLAEQSKIDHWEARMTPNRKTAKRVAAAIASASKRTGVPSRWLISFAHIESNFKPSATNGSSRGLFQMQEAAWRDASTVVPLPPYDSAWDDPMANALAAAAYIKINASALLKRGVDVQSDPRLLYMAHQQGVAGLLELLAASQGQAVRGVVTERAMSRNPPPGGSKPTNRKQFLREWLDYLSRYF